MSSSKAKTKPKKKAKTETELDVRVFKALGHPLRQRILSELNHGVASPNELAKRLDEPLGNVSYHIKILEGYDAIELVRTAPVRGALEHFYQATMRSRLEADQWLLLPESSRKALLGQTLEQIGQKMSDSVAAGALSDKDTTIAWVDLELDDQAVEELTQDLSELLDRALDLQAESLARMVDSDATEEAAKARLTTLSLLHSLRP